jgi:hypothetical protein
VDHTFEWITQHDGARNASDQATGSHSSLRYLARVRPTVPNPRVSLVAAFNIASLMVLVATFCLYEWAHAGVFPFTIAVIVRLMLSLWLWLGRPEQ